jgi:hypothetical protein
MPAFAFDAESHAYTVDGVRLPSVTDICAPLSNFGEINPAIIRQAARRGSLVHEYTELIDYGIEADEIEIEPELAGYVLAYMHFLRDWKPQWELIEQPLYGVNQGYAGTLDRFGFIDGESVILDIKSTSSASRQMRISWAAQLSGYCGLMEFPVQKRLNLWLKPNGTYQIIDAEDTESKYGFDAAELFGSLLDINRILGGKSGR